MGWNSTTLIPELTRWYKKIREKFAQCTVLTYLPQGEAPLLDSDTMSKTLICGISVVSIYVQFFNVSFLVKLNENFLSQFLSTFPEHNLKITWIFSIRNICYLILYQSNSPVFILKVYLNCCFSLKWQTMALAIPRYGYISVIEHSHFHLVQFFQHFGLP